MKSFKVQCLPIKEVLEDLAMKMGTFITANCDVYSLTLPKNYGDGKISGINFLSGIGIVSFDCVFHIPVEINFDANEVHPAKFLYITEGKINHYFSNEDKIHNLIQHQSAILASSRHNGHNLVFKPNKWVKICSIEIDRKTFVKEMRCDIQEMDNALKNLFLDVKAENSFYHEGNYNLKLFDMLRELNISPYEGILQRLFLLSTASGVLREQISQYESDLNHTPKEYLLRRNDVELVKKSVLIINGDMANPTNVEIIAKSVGTNPTKLQQCFKMVYGVTVNGYVKSARLEKAAELLLKSEKNVSVIVKDVGLMNRGYFSKLFKDQYGFTPNNYRKKHLQSVNE